MSRQRRRPLPYAVRSHPCTRRRESIWQRTKLRGEFDGC